MPALNPLRVAQFTQSLAHLNSTQARLTQQISTGQRLSQPVDDPAAWVELSTLARTQSHSTATQMASDRVRHVNAMADQALGTMDTALIAAREFWVAGRNGTIAPADRAAMAQSLRSLAEAITSALATRDDHGDPLFGARPLAVPLDGVTVTASPHRDMIEQIDTAAGPRTIGDIVNAIANAVGANDQAALVAGDDMLSRAADHVRFVHNSIGLTGARIDAMAQARDAATSARAERHSALGNTDMAAAIAQLSQIQTQQSAVQSQFAATHRQSLFDLLR